MTSYKRAYAFKNKYGNIEYLLEERRGDEIRGADQGYVEAEWRLVEQHNRGLDSADIVEYRLNFGWSNDGPAVLDWEDETDMDDPEYMTDTWIMSHYELFTDPFIVLLFIMSRPGLIQELSEVVTSLHGEILRGNINKEKDMTEAEKKQMLTTVLENAWAKMDEPEHFPLREELGSNESLNEFVGELAGHIVDATAEYLKPVDEPTCTVVQYGIKVSGDPMGGSRDSIQIVSEEEARKHVTDGWSRGIKITTEYLKPVDEV